MATHHSISKTEFLNSYFKLLERSGIKNVILHSYEAYPEHIDSDVDYCVRQEDLAKIPALINEFCLSSGWRLVQILQHEVKAFFCICVSLAKPTEYIELDVCSDYMREGKVLLSAAQILEGRRRIEGKSFYVPTSGKEFCYSLWKSVAKSKSLESSSEKLEAIYQQNPEECDAELNKGKMRDLLDKNASWLDGNEEKYDRLREFYKNAPKVKLLSRIKKLYLRVTQPSGLLLSVQNPELVHEKEFLASMKSCFRAIDISLSAAHPVKTPLKVLRTRMVMSDGSKFLTRLLFILCRLFNAGCSVQSPSSHEAALEVHSYLERRLQKRWRF